MANHPNRNRRHYAAQSPRGFSNEVVVHVFRTRPDRDAWVLEHENDGGVNSAKWGAYIVSSRHARRIIGYRGDAAKQGFNRVIEHAAADDGRLETSSVERDGDAIAGSTAPAGCR